MQIVRGPLTRKAFLEFAVKGEPVIIRGFADVSAWSWEALVREARAAEDAGRRVSGEVVVSASGLVPDYRRDAPHASRLDAMSGASLGLCEIFERVSERRAHTPLLCAHERVYSYGRGWMLADDAMRARARAARPSFLEADDLTTPAPHLTTSTALVPAKARGGRAPAEEGEGVCWVGSAGCLTPLHYDLSDGLLAQTIGEKRVWLLPPGAMDEAYLRSPNRPGVDNWERQSQAGLHGAPAAAWPRLARTPRHVADLAPGDCLYIPASWLHEVHSRTASFSLGWRVAMRLDGASGARAERNVGQKLERLATQVKSGAISLEGSLLEALNDPAMLAMLHAQAPQLAARASKAKGKA